VIYLDHNATTPVLPEVLEAMQPYLREQYANPSSTHSAGRRARLAIDRAREGIAALLEADPSEILFTGGATEANNLALKGIAARMEQGQFLTSPIEHPSVLQPLERLARQGFRLTIVPVDTRGGISVDSLEKALGEDAKVLTVQVANNEVGTIQECELLCRWGKEKGLFVHADAAQAVGKIPISLGLIPADTLTFSAHKFYGPKGVGGLFVRRGVRLDSLMEGGLHEKKLRPGTENVAGIVGMAKALEIAHRDMHHETQRLQKLKGLFFEKFDAAVKEWETNGDERPGRQLANTINIHFKGLDAQSLLMNLDLEGICVSTGAACSSGSLEPSPVLIAMSGSKELAKSSLRISMGRCNTVADIDQLVQALARAVMQMRSAHLGNRGSDPLFNVYEG
jgi:cysteine desulfurase